MNYFLYYAEIMNTKFKLQSLYIKFPINIYNVAQLKNTSLQALYEQIN